MWPKVGVINFPFSLSTKDLKPFTKEIVHWRKENNQPFGEFLNFGSAMILSWKPKMLLLSSYQSRCLLRMDD